MKRTKINKKRPVLTHFFKKKVLDNRLPFVLGQWLGGSVDRAVVPTPKVPGSNRIISKIYIER